MREDNRLRQLLRGLRPDIQEKMIIANQESCTAFLQTLQRINQASLLSRASGPQPMGAYYSTGMQSWTQNLALLVGIAPLLQQYSLLRVSPAAPRLNCIARGMLPTTKAS